MFTLHIHGPWSHEPLAHEPKRSSTEAKGILRPNKKTPTNRRGQRQGPLAKSKGNMAVLQGQRKLEETKCCLKKIMNVIYMETRVDETRLGHHLPLCWSPSRPPNTSGIRPQNETDEVWWRGLKSLHPNIYIQWHWNERKGKRNQCTSSLLQVSWAKLTGLQWLESEFGILPWTRLNF